MREGDRVFATAQWLPSYHRGKEATIVKILPQFAIIVEFDKKITQYCLRDGDYVTVKAEVF